MRIKKRKKIGVKIKSFLITKQQKKLKKINRNRVNKPSKKVAGRNQIRLKAKANRPGVRIKLIKTKFLKKRLNKHRELKKKLRQITNVNSKMSKIRITAGIKKSHFNYKMMKLKTNSKTKKINLNKIRPGVKKTKPKLNQNNNRISQMGFQPGVRIEIQIKILHGDPKRLIVTKAMKIKKNKSKLITEFLLVIGTKEITSKEEMIVDKIGMDLEEEIIIKEEDTLEEGMKVVSKEVVLEEGMITIIKEEETLGEEMEVILEVISTKDQMITTKTINLIKIIKTLGIIQGIRILVTKEVTLEEGVKEIVLVVIMGSKEITIENSLILVRINKMMISSKTILGDKSILKDLIKLIKIPKGLKVGEVRGITLLITIGINQRIILMETNLRTITKVRKPGGKTIGKMHKILLV